MKKKLYVSYKEEGVWLFKYLVDFLGTISSTMGFDTVSTNLAYE